MSIHDGHRQRLKDRFRSEGLDHFREHEVLELFLFYCIPRRDTNPIAHDLIDRFGALSKVLEAPPEELAKVPGMGESAATFLSMLGALERYSAVNRASLKKDLIMNTVADCGNYLINFFYNRRNESVYLLCLDAKRKVLCCKEVGEGSVNSAAVSVRRIVEVALGANATTVVLAHNPPSGVALPSGDDVQTTRRVAAALNAVEIDLADHIIVADDDFISLVQSGLYRPGEAQPIL